MQGKVLEVFKAFKVKSSALPITDMVRIDEAGAQRTDMDRTLTYMGNALDGGKSGIYELKQTLVVLNKDYKEGDFPKYKNVEAAYGTIRIDVVRMQDTLRRVLQYTSKDQTRYAMTGMLFEIAETAVRITASDGKRLYREDVPAIVTLSKGKQVPAIAAINNNTIAVLDKMIKAEGSAVCNIAIGKTTIVFKIGNFELATKCIEGEFPSVSSILDKEMKLVEYEIIGLPQALKYLDQFKKREGNEQLYTLTLYPNEATINDGTYDKIAVIKKAEGVKIRAGEAFNPVIVVLHMQSGTVKASAIVQYYADYLKPVAEYLGDRIRFHYDKDSGKGYFSKPVSKW